MDYMIRATAADSQIRAFAATTKETVELARQYHNTSPAATAALGRLLTAGAMMGAMMKGEKDLLTLQVKGGRPHRRPYGNGGQRRRREGLRGKSQGASPGESGRKTGRGKSGRKRHAPGD